MGYDLHITRKRLYCDHEGPTIPLDEWTKYVATDPELRLAPENGLGTVVMNVSSKYPDPWLGWLDGEIYTKNPDEPILEKMLKIASALQATVQGDDGEVYRSTEPNDWYYVE